MIKYLSIDEAISITENKIRGSMFETLGAKQFLDRFINKGQLKPVYYFDGYAVLRHSAPLDFEHELIKNIWRIEGYFKDDHSLFIDSAKIFKSSRPVRDSAFKGLSNSIFKLNQNAGYIHEIIESRFVGDDEIHEIIEKSNLEHGWSYEKSHAVIFNKEPLYERTYGYEDIRETILIDRDNVFFDIEDINNVLKQLPVSTEQHTNVPIMSAAPYLDSNRDNQRIAELEKQLSKFQAAAPDVVNIPFGKRIDLTNKKLPPDERLKESYQIYSNDFSFHEDTHAINTPEEMILRIQGLLKVIGKRDKEIIELKQKLEQIETTDNQDIELSTRSQNLAAKIILALLDTAQLDRESPPYQYDNLNSNNCIIHDQIKANGMKVSPQKIGDWLDLAIKQVTDE